MSVISKTNIYLILFIAIGLAYVIFLVYQNVYRHDGKEHFEEPVNDTQYKANMHVIKVFDVVLSRKPTSDELKKYGKIENEQDILIAVMNDFKNMGKEEQKNEKFEGDSGEGEKKPDTTSGSEQNTHTEPSVTPSTPSEPVVVTSTDKDEEKADTLSSFFKETYDNTVNDARVCLNKKDVLSMLNNLNQQVNSFIAMVK